MYAFDNVDNSGRGRFEASVLFFNVDLLVELIVKINAADTLQIVAKLLLFTRCHSTKEALI